MFFQIVIDLLYLNYFKKKESKTTNYYQQEYDKRLQALKRIDLSISFRFVKI